MSLVHPYLLSILPTTREKYMHRPLIHRDTRVFHSIWRTITVICSNPNLVNMLHLISLFNFVLSYENLYASYCAFALPILVHSKRQFYHETTQHAHWRQEMDDKISVMHVNKTWNGVPLSAHKSSIGCRWIYRNKFHADETLSSHWARLVAKGFKHKEELDFKETFSLVANLVTGELLVYVVASQNCHLTQLDEK